MLGTGVLVAAMMPGAPTLAQDASWTTVVDGLDAPRGMEFGSDGLLYVALAGAGGDQCMEAPGPEGDMMSVCMGATGGVAAVDTATGELTPVVSGLPSVFLEGEGVLGPPDVGLDSMGGVYVLTADGNVPDAPERAEGDVGGIVWKLGEDGTPQQVADMVAYEATANPDGGELDSNPNGIVVGSDGNLYVADAGANALNMIDAEGTISTVAVFADTMVEAPAMPPGEGAEGSEAAESSPDAESSAAAEPAMMPMQQVPTSVTLGSDDALYVTFLRGFPFVPGSAWVARVVPGEEPTVYADGFTNAIGSAFASDGTLYVLEIFHDGMASGDPTGGLWAVPPGGGEPTLVATDGLITPGGIAIGPDDTIYISNGSAQPGGGSIVTLDQ